MYEEESEGKLWERRLATKWIAKPEFELWVPGGHRADLVEHKGQGWWVSFMVAYASYEAAKRKQVGATYRAFRRKQGLSLEVFRWVFK